MWNYYFDANGAFVMSWEAYPGTLPPDNALRIKPPPHGNGFWPVLNAARDGWNLAEDHRGREGYIDGVWAKIDAVGPLPIGWSDEPPVFPDARAPEEMRRDAYQSEADPLFQEAQYYQTEAEGLKALGDYEGAAAAEGKATDLKKAYAQKKAEIRARIPDQPLYLLNSTGTYHMEGCSYAGESGESLSLAEIVARNPNAKPCSRCAPPAHS